MVGRVIPYSLRSAVLFLVGKVSTPGRPHSTQRLEAALVGGKDAFLWRTQDGFEAPKMHHILFSHLHLCGMANSQPSLNNESDAGLLTGIITGFYFIIKAPC